MGIGADTEVRPPAALVLGPLRMVSLGWLSSGEAGRECLKRASARSIPPGDAKSLSGLPYDRGEQSRFDKHHRKSAGPIEWCS